MLDSLPEEEYEAALLVIIHSGITANWLLRASRCSWAWRTRRRRSWRCCRQLYQRLVQIYEQGRKAVVLIDEAQMLETRELMEEFRGLLNLEVPERKLISFVFFGLPEIERNLKLDPPLAQRVAMRYRLEPLQRRDAPRRTSSTALRLAGCAAMPFTPEAIEALHRLSGGSPRSSTPSATTRSSRRSSPEETTVDAPRIEEIARNLALGVRRGARRQRHAGSGRARPATWISPRWTATSRA